MIASATPVGDGLIANPTIYPTPPVDGPTVKTQVATYSTAYTAWVTDGGKKTTAEKKKQEHALIEMLRKDAHYVEGACNQDMATFLLSGFQAATIGPVTPQPLAQPAITRIDYGNSGELIVSISRVNNAKIYQLHYGVAAGDAAPAQWTTMTLPNAKRVKVTSLTPGTTYQFQVQAYGAVGWTA